MSSGFGIADWGILVAYFLVIGVSSVIFSHIKIATSRDYFVASNSVPMFAAAISILATTQSAATFLGGPEYSYLHDLTFMGFFISAFLAVIFVAWVLIPRFYALGAVTVYELLENRYGASAKRAAGVMFLVGRLFASGARLYIGALAVSMILFLDIEVFHVAISVVVLMFGALLYVYFGGVKSVIFSDIIQAFTYIGAAIAVIWYLYISLDSDMPTIMSTLYGSGKLKLISFEGDFSIWALLSGWFLLNVAAYGLDQDMTQRALSCKDAKSAQNSLLFSVLLTLPVAFLFLIIGLLLYLFYAKVGIASKEFDGESVTIFMYYILHEMPEGLRGLVTVGAIAAALSSSNSVLGAMASVMIEDIYKPWRLARSSVGEAHFIRAGRISVVIFAILLSLMAMLSYYWQHHSGTSLLGFALGVMAFAYAGLLGVYGAAIFTARGSAGSVPFALGAGFFTVLVLQPYILGADIGFSWQMVLGTAVSFGVMMLSENHRDIQKDIYE